MFVDPKIGPLSPELPVLNESIGPEPGTDPFPLVAGPQPLPGRTPGMPTDLASAPS